MGIDTHNPFSLAGKSILVTGASSGIGKAIAIACSKMGATLIITGRNQERLETTLQQLEGAGHQSHICEMTAQEEMETLVRKVPPLQGAVFCAGQGLRLPILYSTKDKFHTLFDVNFFAPVELMRLLCKHKKFTKPASAVFIVSIGGTQSWEPGNATYGASKAALQSIVHSYAIELGHKQIRVNGINPGMVETPLIHAGTITEEQLNEDRKRYPLERYGQPEDIAHAAVYLLSDAASWVTGHCLVVDGGITAR